jgi:ATP-dependent 26S proteasome regulatory subunit
LIDSNEDNITLEYLLNLLDGTLTYNDSVVIITTNYIENLDPALYRSGRIDNLVEIKKCDHYQISKIYKRFIQRDIDTEILNKIPEDKFTPAKIIFHLVDWIKKRDEDDSIIMEAFMN